MNNTNYSATKDSKIKEIVFCSRPKGVKPFKKQHQNKRDIKKDGKIKRRYAEYKYAIDFQLRPVLREWY